MKSWQKLQELILQPYFLEMLLYEILNKKSHHHVSLFDVAYTTTQSCGAITPAECPIVSTPSSATIAQ
jgi:hypothetical protein